ncbi:MAG: hypothetical protein WCS34_05085 [Bacteroidales bacterium]
MEEEEKKVFSEVLGKYVILPNYYYFVSMHAKNDYCIFKDEEDYRTMNNILGISVSKNDAVCLGASIMSNHYHIDASCLNFTKLLKSINVSYTAYYNKKYSHKGTVWNGRSKKAKIYFDDFIKSRDKLHYSIGNAARHKLCISPMLYRWNSSRVYFEKKEIENNEIFSLTERKRVKLLTKEEQKKFLPQKMVLPDTYMMNQNGLILPESYIEKSYVERIFHSQSKLYRKLNTKSYTENYNRKVKVEQLKRKLDRAKSQLEKDYIQKKINHELDPSLVKQSDTMVCAELFNICREKNIPFMKSLPSNPKRQINSFEFHEILNSLRDRFIHITQKQCSRCMGVDLQSIKQHWHDLYF